MGTKQNPSLTDPVEMGTSERRNLAIGRRTDGTAVSLPVFVVKGARSGPVLWVQGCLHGDEYAGSRAIHHFVAGLDPDHLSGTVIALPVVNLLAWEQKSRVSPIDYLDLNRVFPGSPQGTWTRLLAHRLLEAISANADFVLDLHGYRSNYFALYFHQQDEAGAMAEQLALDSGAPAVVGVNEAWLDRSMFVVLTRRGIPAILIEAPGEGRNDPEVINFYHQCLQRITIKRGMIQGDASRSSPPDRIKNLISIPAPASGFLDLKVKRGDRVKGGQILARILTAFGDPVAEVPSPAETALVLNLDTHGVIHRGEPLVMIGEFCD
jgi:predicted deacylase